MVTVEWGGGKDSLKESMELSHEDQQPCPWTVFVSWHSPRSLYISSRDATRTQVPPGKGENGREAKGGEGKRKGKRTVLKTASFPWPEHSCKPCSLPQMAPLSIKSGDSK